MHVKSAGYSLLFQKSPDALAAIFRHSGDGVGLHACFQGSFKAHGVHMIEQALRDCHSGGRSRSQMPEILIDGRLEIAGRVDLIDESGFEGGSRSEWIAGEDPFERPLFRDRTAQNCHHHRGDKADIYLGVSELSGFFGQNQVARRGEPAASRQRPAPNRGNNWAAVTPHREEEIRQLPRARDIFERPILERLREFVQIRAGTEIFAGSGEQDHAYLRFRGSGYESAFQLGNRFGIKRIPLVRPVQGNAGDSFRRGVKDLSVVDFHGPLAQQTIIREVNWTLAAGDLHVWRIALNRDPRKVKELEGLLSPREIERAGRFRFEQDRAHYLAAHTALHRLLRGYLGRDLLNFHYGTEGKPSIPRSELRFNLSHSGEWALAAFTFAKEVGVDVERIREGVNRDGIARRFFSPSEISALEGLPEDQRDDAFFRIWTRKEAYVKARGGGLSIPLDSFDVSLKEDYAAILRAPDLERWSIFSLDVEPGYCAAAVAERGITCLSIFDFD